MDLNIMAPLAAPALGHIGTTVRSAAAQMRKALALLLVGVTLALMIAGLTADSAGAVSRSGGGADQANDLIGMCFVTNGDPYVLDFPTSTFVFCVYDDVTLLDIVDDDHWWDS